MPKTQKGGRQDCIGKRSTHLPQEATKQWTSRLLCFPATTPTA